MGAFDFITKRTPVKKEIRPATGWWWSQGAGDADYEIEATYQDFEKAYKNEVWVQRCINLLASCIASVPIKLYKYEGEDKQEIREHSVLKLLDDVNPLTMNASDLWKATVIALKIYGNCYWYLERRGSNEPKEIYWLKPNSVEIFGAKEPDKYIDHFEYTTGNTQFPKVKYSPQDIIHFKYFNPESAYYGLSPLACIRGAISADLYAEAWNKYFFKNSARLDGFFISKEYLTEDQRKEMKKAFESQYKGVKKAHQVGFLEGGWDWKQMSVNPKDAEWSQLRTACREAICSALGVPPVLVVAYEAASYSTAYEQKKSVYHETIIPELHYLAEVLNWNLLPQFKNMEHCKLEFDLTEVPALQDEASDKYERLFRATGVPYMTPNEARNVLGWAKSDDPNADKLHFPLNMLPSGGE